MLWWTLFLLLNASLPGAAAPAGRTVAAGAVAAPGPLRSGAPPAPLVAPAAAAAAGGRRGGARSLQQTSVDCRSVPNCVMCRYQAFRSTVTRAVCLSCAAGYVVKASGRACWCAPGFYRVNATTCVPCGNNYFCPGAKSTDLSGATRISCGANQITTTLYAVSDRECLVKPGYGWGFGDTSAPCAPGTYNPGYNTRKCSPCPGSLTTAAPGATSVQQCRAGPGYYYLGGRAVPCAQGFYKPSFGNSPCLPCPAGWTTGDVGKVSASDCNYVMAGYCAPPGMLDTLGSTPALPCPANTYQPAANLYGPAEDAGGLNCTACGANMQTLAGVLGAVTENACLVPPGFGFESSNITAFICPRGTFNAGWNREGCAVCGGGTITTDTEGSTTSDQCKVPAGHGTTRAFDGSLSAAPCPVGTYGRDSDSYGLLDVTCSKCLEFTTTLTNGSTSGAQCLTLPGYGYYSGAVEECGFAQFSPGGAQDPCGACGEGYNTSTGANGTDPIVGAAAPDSCVVAAGWTPDGSGGVKPCVQGYYKSLLGPSDCAKCPSGTTTTITIAAAALSDCDSCRPGFGTAAVNLSSPACPICPSGTYSFGFVSGGEACQPCPKPDDYTGDMVSRRGLPSPDGCYPEFMTDAAFQSLHYDYIPMAGAGVFDSVANVTAAACEQLCHASGACQYYAFFNYTVGSGGGGTVCNLRNAGLAAADIYGATTSSILFQISESVYVAYLAHATDWASTGVDLSLFSSPAAAIAACNQQAPCVGVKSQGGAWKTFAGARYEGAVGKVRVRGEAITPWIAEPSPD